MSVNDIARAAVRFGCWRMGRTNTRASVAAASYAKSVATPGVNRSVKYVWVTTYPTDGRPRTRGFDNWKQADAFLKPLRCECVVRDHHGESRFYWLSNGIGYAAFPARKVKK